MPRGARVAEYPRWVRRHTRSDGMNEAVLNTLAEVAITLAGFSGVAVVFRLRGAHSWTPTELRVLWFLIGDSFLVLFFSLLPFPLALANWSPEALWGFCNALLGSWFIIGDVLALRGERRDRVAQQLITVPVITPILYAMSIGALAMGITLWLSALDLLVARGQAVYVLGLITLLAFAAVEFLFFIGLVSRQGKEPVTPQFDDHALRRLPTTRRPLRDGAAGGEHVPVDPPAHDPPRADAEHLRGEAGAERLAPAPQHLGLAADLDPAHSPRIHRGQVVHDERNPGVALHILVLLPPGEVVPPDIDRVQLRVVPEPDGDYMRLAVRTDGRQPPQQLTLQVVDLSRCEDVHPHSLHGCIAPRPLPRQAGGRTANVILILEYIPVL
jgi:hypothetical protein